MCMCVDELEGLIAALPSHPSIHSFVPPSHPNASIIRRSSSPLRCLLPSGWVAPKPDLAADLILSFLPYPILPSEWLGRHCGDCHG